MSRFDRNIDQLAFGAAAPSVESSLGLYLGPDVIYLSETRLAHDKLVVDHLIRIQLNDGKDSRTTATMSSDFLANPTKIVATIRQSMAQLRWGSKNVRVTLSHHSGLLRYFVMPMIERRFLHSAVPLEAKKYIPIPFDVLAHDFQVAPLPVDADGKQRLGVLIAVTQKKNVAHIQGLLAMLGLRLIGLEVAPCSVVRLWQLADPRKNQLPFAHVHIDGGNVRIMIVDHDVPIFFREVFLGQKIGLSDLRKIDLPGCLAFVQKQLGSRAVSSLRVSGDAADVKGVLDAFSAETGLKASFQDLPALLSLKNGDWGGYASIGASARSLTPLAPPPLDLAATDRVSDDEHRTARDIIVAGAAAAAFFAVGGLVNLGSYAYRAQELHQYQRRLDPEVKASLGGLATSADIEALLKDMQSQLEQLRLITVDGQRLKISAILKEIVAAMPPRLWLDRIVVTDRLMGGDRQSYGMTLHGYVEDSSVASEQAIVFLFKDALIKNPKLGQAFDIAISVRKVGDGSIPPPSSRPAAEPKAAAESAKRTQFELQLRAKR